MTDQLIDALNSVRQTRTCQFNERRKQLLTPEQNEALTFAIRNPTKSTRDIVEALKSFGFPISRDTIAAHRRGNCLVCQTTT